MEAKRITPICVYKRSNITRKGERGQNKTKQNKTKTNKQTKIAQCGKNTKKNRPRQKNLHKQKIFLQGRKKSVNHKESKKEIRAKISPSHPP